MARKLKNPHPLDPPLPRRGTGGAKAAGGHPRTPARGKSAPSELPRRARSETGSVKRDNGSNGAAQLVVVESPAKARTIERILGANFTVRASLGHVRDLPTSEMGVDIENGFTPHYEVPKEKAAVIRELKKLGQAAPVIYMATDPDREGEAISWHILKATGWKDKPIHRVAFHEITQEAVAEAFKHPRDIDMQLVNAQQARRILDRLVGYQLSPLLWRKVQKGLSAGRVQSVALRLVVDREREVQSFIPQEYWTVHSRLQKLHPAAGETLVEFTAALVSLRGRKGKLEIPDKQAADVLLADLKGASYSVAGVTKRQVRQTPSPPFTTSTLQQEAWRKLRFSAKKTMLLAQHLYEGLPVGSEGSVGLITYMRTDSTHVAPSAIAEARAYIREKFGESFLPPHARAFTRKAKGAQEAHEAIRPTSAHREPEGIKGYLTPDHLRLYELIWRRMVASQMAEAVSDSTSIDIDAACTASPSVRQAHDAKVYLFKVTGTVLRFPGFRTLYLEGRDEQGDDVLRPTKDEENGKTPLPELARGEELKCLGIESKQHFTQPPPRYTEATLVKMLEERGIGRPSTYAPIISTIQDRNYVVKEQGRFKPTALGTTVSDLLTQHFADIMDLDFTARMEEELDEIARGEREWVPMLKDFYTPFKKSIEVATEKMPRVRVEEPTDEVCEKCGKPMVIKTGRFGRFVACTGFPTCRNTHPIKATTGAKCPECGGELVERRAKKRGRVFYGCSRYPACTFTVSQQPLADPCPECGKLLVAAGKGRTRCTACKYRGDAQEKEAEAVEAPVG